MFRLVIIIFLFAFVSFSQQKNTVDQSNQTQAADIIRNARQAVGLDKTGEVFSYFYKSKKTIPLKEFSNYESFEEVSLEFPDKIKAIYTDKIFLSSQSPSSSQLTRTWNGKMFKSIGETEFSGQRIVRDTTNEENKTVSKTVSEVIGKKQRRLYKTLGKLTRKIFLRSRSGLLFSFDFVASV